MSHNDWFAIIAFCLTTNGVLIRIVWNTMEERLKKVEGDIKATIETVFKHEEKNYYVRHNFDPVTKALQNQIETEDDHTREIIDTKLSFILEKIENINRLLEKFNNTKQ